MMTVKLFKAALVALRVNVLRSILAMLGIIIGVSAVIIMVALGAGAQREVDSQIKALGGNVNGLVGLNVFAYRTLVFQPDQALIRIAPSTP